MYVGIFGDEPQAVLNMLVAKPTHSETHDINKSEISSCKAQTNQQRYKYLCWTEIYAYLSGYEKSYLNSTAIHKDDIFCKHFKKELWLQESA